MAKGRRRDDSRDRTRDRSRDRRDVGRRDRSADRGRSPPRRSGQYTAPSRTQYRVLIENLAEDANWQVWKILSSSPLALWASN